MFTGIIQELGEITAIASKGVTKKFTILAPHLTPTLKIGDSVATDGSCLTVITIDEAKEHFEVEAIPETLNRTLSGSYQLGQKVNLETSLKLSDKLDGHMVSGHVDQLGKVIDITQEGEVAIVKIELSEDIRRYVAFKGSITVNGVSLTVSLLKKDFFEINLIPHTQKITNLGELKTDSQINLEVDLLARYIENMINKKEQESNYFFLQERGFL